MTQNTGKSEIVVGNFKGIPINFFRRTQRINVIDIEKATGKRWRNWLATNTAQEYIEAWQEMPSNRHKESAITVKAGTKDDGTLTLKGSAEISANPQLGGIEAPGTWADPAIALAYAQWADVRLHLWCNLQILHLLEYGEVNLNHQEWTPSEYDRGCQLNRDDIKEMYGR
jgi:hypothetical protein